MRFGGASSDQAYSIDHTSDGGYVIAGVSTSSLSGDVSDVNNGGADFWIVKFNADGTKAWDKLYGGNSYETAYAIRQTSDGYIIAGETLSSSSGDVTGTNNGGRDWWILKLDANGNKLWDLVYGTADEDIAYSIELVSDGYIIAGYVINSPTSLHDMRILKLSTAGAIQWQKDYSYASTGSDIVYSIKQTTDGGYILAGLPGYILKLDSSRNVQWNVAVNPNNLWEFRSIQQTTDGGYIAVGSTGAGDGPNGGRDVILMKLSTSGVITWQKYFGGSSVDTGRTVYQTSDGGYIIGAYSSSSASGTVSNVSNGSNDYWVIKVNSLGNVVWNKLYGGSGNDILYDLQPTGDGGYRAVGYSVDASAGTGTQIDLTSQGGSDWWILKLDANGNLLEQK